MAQEIELKFIVNTVPLRRCVTISIRWAASTMTRAVAEYLLRNAG